jgi:hypothetical protein
VLCQTAHEFTEEHFTWFLIRKSLICATHERSETA